MILFATILFLLSLLGVVALFALKHWEALAGRVLAPSVERYLDMRALQGKELLIALQADLEKLPPELVHFARVGIRIVALETARFARFLEAQAHRLPAPPPPKPPFSP